jgi:GNAT superfamily N-acetyltransferase
MNTVRWTTIEDKADFVTLIGVYLQEEWDKGGLYPPTDFNIQQQYLLWEDYMLGHAHGGCVFGYVDGKLAGFNWGGEWPARPLAMESPRLGKVCWVNGIYVKPEYRGRGLGGMMTAAATKKTADQGFNTLMTDVRDGNVPAETTAERHAGMTRRSTMIMIELSPMETE